jgi:hypothetical protein
MSFIEFLKEYKRRNTEYMAYRNTWHEDINALKISRCFQCCFFAVHECDMPLTYVSVVNYLQGSKTTAWEACCNEIE